MVNLMTNSSISGCPVHDNIDRRKTAKLAAENNKQEEGAYWVKMPAIARKVLRSPKALQAGAGADLLHYKEPEQAPVFFLDGEEHANKRRSSLRFLSPKAVSEKHFTVMNDDGRIGIAQLNVR
jgi:hypothetical protein